MSVGSIDIVATRCEGATKESPVVVYAILSAKDKKVYLDCQFSNTVQTTVRKKGKDPLFLGEYNGAVPYATVASDLKGHVEFFKDQIKASGFEEVLKKYWRFGWQSNS